MDKQRQNPKPVVTPSRPLILIVDDDQALRAMIATRLRREGFDTIEAGETAPALELVRQHRVDLACVDLMLPIESGFSLCSALRRDPKNAEIGIVVVTARTSLEDTTRAMESGADRVVYKPVRMPEFLATVRAVLADRKEGRVP